jgi:hypothetical protein
MVLFHFVCGLEEYWRFRGGDVVSGCTLGHDWIGSLTVSSDRRGLLCPGGSHVLVDWPRAPGHPHPRQGQQGSAFGPCGGVLVSPAWYYILLYGR